MPVIIREDLNTEEEKLKKLLATNFGRLKNNPVKQGKVYSEYERLCGVYHGNHQKVNPQNVDSLTQEQGERTKCPFSGGYCKRIRRGRQNVADTE